MEEQGEEEKKEEIFQKEQTVYFLPAYELDINLT